MLAFVGDVMLDRGVLYQADIKNDPALPFRKIKDRLNQADILFGNLESMISDQGHNQGSAYSFRAPPKMMEGLVLADFDILSIANNHSFDWTINALLDTKDRLEKENIKALGAGKNPYSPVIIKEDETSFAFIGHTAVGAPGWAATETSPGVAWYESEKLKAAIEKAKEKSDIIIFSIHFGTEYETTPNENQKQIAREAIDMGADLVIGHHPHVTQPTEEYKDGLIAYSLGNFVFDQDFSKETSEGLLLEVKIKDGEIIDHREINTVINDQFQPTIK
ncbi:MAG: CapA family protein [Patescibacteria group bacterium]